MATENELETVFESINENMVDPLVDALMMQMKPSENADALRKEIADLFGIVAEKERINSGLDAAIHYFNEHLQPQEVETIKHEWELGAEKLTEEIGKQNNKGIDPYTTLQSIMKLSDQTLERFYEAGVAFYGEERFDKAADIFFVASLLNCRRYNIWMSLGFAEFKCKRFDLALDAFAMAIITNSELPQPYMCSAECCLAKSDFEQAQLYLDSAIDLINQKGLNSHDELMKQINTLKLNLTKK